MFLPGESQGWGSLVGCRLWGRTESDTTEEIQYTLVAQMVKHLLTVWETWVGPLGWEDSLEKAMAPHFSTLAWKIHGQRRLVGCNPWGR